MFAGKISGEELLELPLRQFEGEIVTVETAGMAKAAARYLQSFQSIGFDTETRPAFKKGESHKVALLQLATHDRAYIIRIQKTGLPPGVSDLLSDPHVLKAGVAIRDDLKALQKVQSFRPAGFVELQEKARQLGINDYSLKKLCAILLGFRISKSQQLSNWESDQLTEQQLLYAATDAWVSLKIHEKLMQIANDGTIL